MSSTISSLGDLEESLISEWVVKTIAKDGVKIEGDEIEENTSKLCKLNGKTMWKTSDIEGELFVDDVVRIITRISVHNLKPCSRSVVTGVT
jgi:hypothetical protein